MLGWPGAGRQTTKTDRLSHCLPPGRLTGVEKALPLTPGVQCGAGWYPARDPEGAPGNRRASRLPIGSQVAFRPTCPTAPQVFHKIPRVEGPLRQTTKTDRLSHRLLPGRLLAQHEALPGRQEKFQERLRGGVELLAPPVEHADRAQQTGHAQGRKSTPAHARGSVWGRTVSCARPRGCPGQSPRGPIANRPAGCLPANLPHIAPGIS